MPPASGPNYTAQSAGNSSIVDASLIQSMNVARVASPAAPLPKRMTSQQLAQLVEQPSIPFPIHREATTRAYHSASFYANILGIRSQMSSDSKSPQSSYNGDGTGGQGGFVFYKNYDDAYALLSAWINNGSVYIPPPSSGSGGGWAAGGNVAANLHPGTSTVDNTGNCLEAGTGFYTDAGMNYSPAIFWVGDFCNLGSSGGIEAFPIQMDMNNTPNFQSNYIRSFGSDSTPRITLELEQPLGGDGSWHAYLYNYSSSHWDDIYHNYGDFLTSFAGTHATNPNIGWSLHETNFRGSAPCPKIPTFSANDIQMAVESGNDASNYFRALQFSDYYVSKSSTAMCYSDDGTFTGAVYEFLQYQDPWNVPAWEVLDPVPVKPGTTPTPRPINSPNPCLKNPRLCEAPIRTPTPGPSPPPHKPKGG